MEKNSNDLLMLGISILVIGLFLGSYSISTYTETKSLANKIDFEELEENIQLSSSDKYYKYLSNADFLNQKINKNKGILIKNSSCIYLDYAQHNAIGLYNLVYKKMEADDTKRSVTAGNIRTLYTILDNYNTCKQTAQYKTELQNLLVEIQNINLNRADSDIRMQKFLNSYDRTPTRQQSSIDAPADPRPELDPIPEDEQMLTPQMPQKDQQY